MRSTGSVLIPTGAASTTAITTPRARERPNGTETTAPFPAPSGSSYVNSRPLSARAGTSGTTVPYTQARLDAGRDENEVRGEPEREPEQQPVRRDRLRGEEPADVQQLHHHVEDRARGEGEEQHRDGGRRPGLP